MFGTLPVNGFFCEQHRVGGVEVVTEKPDRWPTFWLEDVRGADFFRVKTSRGFGLQSEEGQRPLRFLEAAWSGTRTSRT